MYGTGIIKGMWVTLRHLMDTYLVDGRRFPRRYNKEVLALEQSPKARGIFTLQYPEERLQKPERFRYFPFLVLDTQKGELRCTACGICAKVCPPQCIWITRFKTPEGKPQPKPAEFVIDLSVCMGCGLCAEFCPFDSIKMDNNYEISTRERLQTLLYDKAKLTKPDTYYAAGWPKTWAEEEATRRKGAQK
jgi:NADH-quinone oxidoreductase subunit I